MTTQLRPELHSLYDTSIHFFDNVQKGPRFLTADELAYTGRLKDDISRLEEQGLSLRRELLPDVIVDSPLGIGAGIAYGSKFLDLYRQLGYGLLTQKTVRDGFWKGNPTPHIVYLDGGNYEDGFTSTDEPTRLWVSNSFGIHCFGIGNWEPDIGLFVAAHPETPLIVSGVVTLGTDKNEIIRQYAEIGRRVKRVGAAAYEINVSCPNEMEGHSGEIQDDAGLVREIVQETRQQSGLPVLVKIGYRPPEALAKFVRHVGDAADGIVAINTMPAIVRNHDGNYAYGDRRPRAGVSGDPLKPYAEEALGMLVELRERFGDNYRIISVGGVTEPVDVKKRLDMRADAVESAVAAMSYPPFGLEAKKYLLEQELRK